MSCTNPLKAFTVGINAETGKKKLKICSRDVQYLERSGHTWIKHFDDAPAEAVDTENFIFSYDYIPCGNCYSCRMTRAHDWTVRSVLESYYHEENYFVTLTYADDNLPYNFDMLNGELTGKSTLVKSHLQKFLKRVRKNLPDDNSFLFLGSGEYGTCTQRPHFHLSIFGLHLDDLVEYKKTSLGYSLYNSEFLSRCWSRPCKDDEEPDFTFSNGGRRKYLGFVVVAPLTLESAGYVARYCVKKQGDSNGSIYDDFLIDKEFITMSRRPALGLQYYLDNRDKIYKFDSIYLKDGKVVKPPRYFDKLYERDFPEKMAVIKANRKKVATVVQDAVLDMCDYDLDQYLSIKDLYYRERTKSLQRKEI